MLKTRIQTVIFLAVYFLILLGLGQTWLLYIHFAGILVLLSKEWQQFPQPRIQYWRDLTFNDIAYVLTGALLVSIFSYAIWAWCASSIVKYGMEHSNITVFFIFILKIYSLAWVLLMVQYLFFKPYLAQDGIWQRIYMQYMPLSAPWAAMLALLILFGVPMMQNLPFGLMIFTLIWLGDSLGYFIGKRYGKHLLAPKISPKKTIEGACAGILGGSVLVFIVYAYDAAHVDWRMLLFFMLVQMVGIMGDLFESQLKRTYGVKDSSQLLPGHGGFFDRFDAMLPAILASMWIF